MKAASALAARVRTLWLVGVATLINGGDALAHHSYAMFDRDKQVDASAQVRSWEFTNPHATLWVYVTGGDGKLELWALEAPGPNQLLRNGWDNDSVKPGDKVMVRFNPLRDGRRGGTLLKIVLQDGRALATGGPPSAPPGAEAPKAP